MSVLEAMSYEIPTISTEVGGISRLINNDEQGYLIKLGYKYALKKNLELLISSEDRRQYMSSNAYYKIKNKFSIDSSIKKLEEIYSNIC